MEKRLHQNWTTKVFQIIYATICNNSHNSLIITIYLRDLTVSSSYMKCLRVGSIVGINKFS